MDLPRLVEIIGLAGVSKAENVIARGAGRFVNYGLLLLALWLSFQWYLETKNLMTPEQIQVANSLVLVFFVFEVVLQLAMVNNKVRHIRKNWMHFVFLLCGIVLVLRVPWLSNQVTDFRPLLVAALLVPWLEACYLSLSDNLLVTTLFTAAIVITLAGVFIAGLDPNIKSITDGIWYAWVTVTTVGYGDEVPVSLLGRLFGAVLILTGLGLFAIITANFAALFLKVDVREVKRDSEDIRRILKNIQAMKVEENQMLEVLADINTRLRFVERRVKPQDTPRSEIEG